MMGSPGFMPPPPMGTINDNVTTPNKGFQTDSGGGNPMSPIFNFHFNPSGGLGNPMQGTSGGFMTPNSPIFQGGPTYQRGGPGWMPPPPIQGVGGQGGNPMQRPSGGPMRVPPPVTYPPTQQPPNDPRGSALPGWAGYLQWLNLMGAGGRMPPPPIQGLG